MYSVPMKYHPVVSKTLCTFLRSLVQVSLLPQVKEATLHQTWTDDIWLENWCLLLLILSDGWVESTVAEVMVLNITAAVGAVEEGCCLFNNHNINREIMSIADVQLE